MVTPLFDGFWVYSLKVCTRVVRNLRLIQPMVITLEGGRGVNRVMVSFCKFKQMYARDNYMQVYNNKYIDNCI